MKTTETLFKSKTEIDNKSILNKHQKRVSKTILDQIEAGVTVETLDTISKSGIPILKYGTQITIHGLFDNLENNYIFGYKNIFQNKNKSIGVKYNAIDEAKRQRIAKRLKCIGLDYTRNSQETKFSIVKRIDKDNFEQVKNEMFALKGKIDNSLFFGSVYIWRGNAWGQQYLCFDLYINAIYEANIEPFLNSLGASIEVFEAKEAKDNAEHEAYIKGIEIERAERKLKRKEILKDNESDLVLLSVYPKVEKTTEPGLYLLRMFDYNDKLIYKVINLYMPKGKKKPRAHKKEFDSIKEALSYGMNESYSDSIYGGRITGRKIE